MIPKTDEDDTQSVKRGFTVVKKRKREDSADNSSAVSVEELEKRAHEAMKALRERKLEEGKKLVEKDLPPKSLFSSEPVKAGQDGLTYCNFQCSYCHGIKLSMSSGADGRVRIRCKCGGKHRDGRPRMHAKWERIKDTDVDKSKLVAPCQLLFQAHKGTMMPTMIPVMPMMNFAEKAPMTRPIAQPVALTHQQKLKIDDTPVKNKGVSTTANAITPAAVPMRMCYPAIGTGTAMGTGTAVVYFPMVQAYNGLAPAYYY